MKLGIVLPSCRTQSSRQTTLDTALAAEGIGFDPRWTNSPRADAGAFERLPVDNWHDDHARPKDPGKRLRDVRNAGMESTLTHSHVQSQGKREHAICPLMTQYAAEVA